jgi:hypothetical protein
MNRKIHYDLNFKIKNSIKLNLYHNIEINFNKAKSEVTNLLNYLH